MDTTTTTTTGGTAVTAEPGTAAATAGDGFQARKTFIVAAGHLSHDIYSSFLGVLIPAVQAKLGISLAVVSLMIPAQQLPSVVQPAIGYVADRTTRKWFVVAAPTVAAVSLSCVGLAPSVAVVLLLLMASGLASAAFHTAAIALVGEYGGKRMGRAMSIFMAFGDSARTIGPLLITAAIALFTLKGSAVVMVFGIAASVVLFFTLDTRESDARRRATDSVAFRPLLRARRKAITSLLGVYVINGLVTLPFQYFLVKLLITNGRSDWYGGIALSLLSGAGIAGGLIAGSLSDRIGRKTIMTIAAVASAPLFYLYLVLENGSWQVLLVLMAAGFVALSVRPVTLAMGQELVPEARSSMSGLMLALSYITTGVASIGFGTLGDAVGIREAFLIVAGVSLLALPFVVFLPDSREIRRLTA
ncbi:MAG TPA: MFS transporter [Thermomicrobiaceae bacterium]|nr:MFS transporter [Thermomicrobiaceae bacterium]